MADNPGSDGWSRVQPHLPGMALALVLALLSTGLAKLPGLSVMGPLTIALLLGIAIRARVGLPPSTAVGIKTSARTVLRLGIVLMGARLDFRLVAAAGPKLMLLVSSLIALGLFAIPRIGRRFLVPERLGMLLAVGTSICGASAVVAAAPVVKAPQEDVTLAVALCGILGTLGVFLFMLVGPFLGLTTPQLAILAGASLHEVAQVMAAAFSWGTEAGDLGTLVKLSRVVLLAPALVVLSVVTGGGIKSMKFTWQDPPIPYFVLGFLGMGVLASSGYMPAPVKSGLSTSSVFLMTMAMGAMGLNTPLELLKAAGARVFQAGILGFLLLCGVGYALILGMGMG